MKAKDKQDLRQYYVALITAQRLRTFPNSRKMDLFEATFLNQLGKLIEKLGFCLYNLMEGKKQRKVLQIIGNTDYKLDKIILKKNIIDSRA